MQSLVNLMEPLGKTTTTQRAYRSPTFGCFRGVFCQWIPLVSFDTSEYMILGLSAFTQLYSSLPIMEEIVMHLRKMDDMKFKKLNNIQQQH